MLIIGGGAAGLAAANFLSKQGVRIDLLEARDRLGGRIHTVTSETGDLPIDLGAEFVHGQRNTTWQFIREAGLSNARGSGPAVGGAQWDLKRNEQILGRTVGG